MLTSLCYQAAGAQEPASGSAVVGQTIAEEPEAEAAAEETAVSFSLNTPYYN